MVLNGAAGACNVVSKFYFFFFFFFLFFFFLKDPLGLCEGFSEMVHVVFRDF